MIAPDDARRALQVGFAAYEARKRLPETPTVDFPQPAWDGGEIAGMFTLLSIPSRAWSDALLFVRFAREPRRAAARM